MQLTVSANKNTVADVTGGGASFINTEGIFDIVLKFASISSGKNGSKSLNLNIEWNGNSQTIWGPTIQNNNGQPNDIGLSLVNKLSVIAGLGDGDVLDIEDQVHKVGKDGKEQEFKVITNFSDLPCKIRVQREFSEYQGKIQERLLIRNVFREDGATAAELLEGGEIGVQMAKEAADHVNGPYLRGVTQEQVDAFIESRKKNRGADDKSSAATPTGKIVGQAAALFE